MEKTCQEPSPHQDPEQGHCLPSPIDQPALNVKAHSSHCGASSLPLAPSLARDLLSGDTTALMTRFGSCSTGLLGLGRWKLRISSWKVTVDKASHSKFPLLYPQPIICIACLDTEVVHRPLLNCFGSCHLWVFFFFVWYG